MKNLKKYVVTVSNTPTKKIFNFFPNLYYMINKDSVFISLLKKHTNIDTKFINTFF
jgi:hypothetical protein